MSGSRGVKVLVYGSALLALLACSLPGSLPAKPTGAPVTPTASAATPSLVPTLEPSPTANLAPTSLPAPTQILPPTAPPAGAGQTGTPVPGAEAGIRIDPALGEPGDIVIATGNGFPAGAAIALRWIGPQDNPLTAPGIPGADVKADANGFFTEGLKVPSASEWPGSAPQEKDRMRLRATSPALGVRYYYADFTYVKRFNPNATAAGATITGTP